MRSVQRNMLTRKIIDRSNDLHIIKSPKDSLDINDLILAVSQISLDVIEDHLEEEKQNKEYIDKKIKSYLERAVSIIKHVPVFSQVDQNAIEVAKMIQIQENK